MKTTDLGFAAYLYALGFIPEVEGDGKRKTFIFVSPDDAVSFENMKVKYSHYQATDIDVRSYFEAVSSIKSLLYD
jgi:hypothetical protein